MSRLSAIFMVLAYGCGTSDPKVAEEGGTDAGGDACSCAAIEARLLAEVSGNRSCATDKECSTIALRCLLVDRPTCSDAFYINLDADVAQLESDSAALDACAATCDPERHCGGCLMGYPAVCDNGTCAPDISP
ncbi:MAG: hypothetical protein IPI67_26610 [Myxococcales bacterium]|nr:hypothetical protein [Myxococcales bacterium]